MRLAALQVGLVLYAASALAQAPQPIRLGDLNATVLDGASSTPANFTVMGGKAYFAATTSLGTELWVTDGTAAGTTLVKDINPGLASSSPSNLVVIGTTLYFQATVIGIGTELWMSDGTANGTVLVRDVNMGSGSSTPRGLATLGTTLFFYANDGASGIELWKSDGTTNGTVLVKDINPSGNALTTITSPGVALNGKLYFAATDGTTGEELWMSDGTGTNTVQVLDIYPGPSPSTPRFLTVMGGALYFQAQDGTHNLELWKSDGSTAGTAMLKDIMVGSNGSSPDFLAALGNVLLFRGAVDLMGNRRMFVSDGTAAGTVALPGGPYLTAWGSSGMQGGFTVFGSKAFFAGSDTGLPGFGDLELWSTDGTAMNTARFSDINPGGAGSNPNYLTPAGTNLFFCATNGTSGNELFVFDGATVSLTKDIRPSGSGFFAPPAVGPPPIIALGSSVLFVGDDGVTGQELWSSDGTPPGTNLVRNLNASVPTASSQPTGFVALPGKGVFFAATSTTSGREPFFTDGTSAGTVMLADVNPGPAGSGDNSSGLLLPSRAIGSTLFFLANDPTNGPSLWGTDGTPAGTALLLAEPGGLFGGSFGQTELGTVGGKLLFMGVDPAAGLEPFVSDGTPAGSALLADVNPGASGSFPAHFTAVGGVTVFAADDGIHGNELWVTDGTPGGTALLKDINASGASNPAQFVADGPRAWFVANDGTSNQVWRTDGTAGNTLRASAVPGLPTIGSAGGPAGVPVSTGLFFVVLSPSPGTVWFTNGTPAGSHAVPATPASGELAALGAQALFSATDSHGVELWVSDGTSASLLKDLSPGAPNSNPNTLMSTGSMVYFFATDDGGSSLWKSDGTAAGTVPVLGSATSSAVIGLYGSTLLLALNDPASGVRLWRTNGTDAGTVQYGLPAFNGTFKLGASPAQATAKGLVAFAASDLLNDVEPWAADLTPPVVTPMVTGTTGQNGWYVSDVNVTWISSDSETSITSTPCMPVSVTTDTVTTLSCSATSSGGTTVGSVQIKRDATPLNLTCPMSPAPVEATSYGGATVVFPPPSLAPDVASPMVSVAPSSGSTFSLGTTLVTASASNLAGAMASCSFPVTVTDTTAPDVHCPPPPLPFAASDPDGGIATYDPATALDKSDPHPVITYSRDAGTLFPIGITTVTATAADDAGNRASCTFDVTVGYTAPLLISCQGDVSTTAYSDAGTTVTFSGTQVQANPANTPVDPIAYVPANGSVFPVGTTQVTATATSHPSDGGVFTRSCTFNVTVTEMNPLSITCPSNVNATAYAMSGAPVTYPDAVAVVAPVGVPVMLSYDHPSGSTFPVGATTVTATAMDNRGNSRSCTFSVTVAYMVPLTLTCPSDLTQTAYSDGGMLVVYPAPAVTVNPPSEPVTVVTAPDSGTAFPIGDTMVHVTASDARNNIATCSFDVRVNFEEPLLITCPPDVTKSTSSDAGTPVSFDDVQVAVNPPNEPVTKQYSSHSGDSFPIGTTAVTVTASDTRGNVRSCTFDVTVKLGVPLAVSCPAELDVTAPDGTGAVVDPLPVATTATDNGQPPTVTYSPASGTKFPLGRTQVIVTAMDDRMNVQTCTFDVVVTPGNQSPYAWSCACSNAGAAPLVALLAALALRRRRRR